MLFLEKTEDEGTELEHQHIVCVDWDDYERDVDLIPCVVICLHIHAGFQGHITRQELSECTFCDGTPEMFTRMTPLDRVRMEEEFADTRVMLDRLRMRGRIK